jgi:hypothetical protein
MRRLILMVAMLGAFVCLTPAARAGGWANVTLDSLPTDVRAGQALSIGFMVRQHGITPVSKIGDLTLKPYLLAVHAASKTEIRADARQSGEVGHFVVEVTFPKDGAWTFKIVPAPFPDPVEIGFATEAAVIPLEVKAPLVGEPGGDPVRAAQPAQAAPASVVAAPAASRRGVWLATGGIVGVAIGLTLLVQRGALRRRTAS